tara:strand:- start:8237 stop:9211 length:975 start_codon:yes stop_codon:yes gene_type:complete
MPFKGEPVRSPSWLPTLFSEPWDLGSSAIARTLKHARTARGLNPSRVFGLQVRALEFCSDDGVRLDAWYLPAAKQVDAVSPGCVVLHHHYGGQKATLLPWLEFFHRKGFDALCFDARGHGASGPSPEGRGSFVHRAADVRAACNKARDLGAQQIIAFGQSQGAAALVMGIHDRDDVVACIVDSGPAPDMASAAWGLAGNMLGRLAGERPVARALLSARILPGTHPLLYQAALWQALFGLRSRPLLWIHGARDRVIPRQSASLWFKLLRPAGQLWQGVEVAHAEHVRCLAVGGVELEVQVEDFLARAGLGLPSLGQPTEKEVERL